MARDFNGTTDRIDYGSAFDTTGQALTVAGWIWTDEITPATSKFIWNSAISSGGSGTVFFQNQSLQSLGFTRVYSSGTSKLYTSAWTISTATWTHVAVTCPGTASGAVNFYYNGGVTPNTTTTNGSGTEATANSGFSLGGLVSADTRNWNGRMENMSVWNRVLSAAEILALARRAPPTYYGNGLKFHARLVGADYTNVYDATGTLDGTTEVASGTIYVRRPRLQLVNAPGVQETSISGAATSPFEPGETVTLAGTLLNATNAGAVIKRSNGSNSDALTSYSPSSAIAATGVIPNRPTKAPYTTAGVTVVLQSAILGVASGSPLTITHNPPTGYSVVEVASPDLSSQSLLSYVGWTATGGDQIEWDNSVTVDATTVAVTVNADGTVELDSSPNPMPSSVSFKWRAYSTADDQWTDSASDASDWATATFGAASVGFAGMTRSITSSLARGLLRAV